MIFRPRRHQGQQRRAQPGSNIVHKDSTAIVWLKNLGLLAAVFSTVGALFGYGVAMGLSSQFGLGTGAWYTSAIELVSLSGEGVLGVFAEFKNFEESVFRFVGYALWYALASGLIMLVLWIKERFGHRYGSHVFKWIRASFQKTQELLPQKKFPVAILTTVEGAFFAVVGGIMGFLAIPVGAAFIAVLFSLVGLVPALGVFAGTAYARSIIINNAGCVSKPAALQAWETRRRSADKVPDLQVGIQCVQVSGGANASPVSGRVVVARPNYLVLYIPAQDSTVLVPIRDANIMAVSSLSP